MQIHLAEVAGQVGDSPARTARHRRAEIGRRHSPQTGQVNRQAVKESGILHAEQFSTHRLTATARCLQSMIYRAAPRLMRRAGRFRSRVGSTPFEDECANVTCSNFQLKAAVAQHVENVMLCRLLSLPPTVTRTRPR